MSALLAAPLDELCADADNDGIRASAWRPGKRPKPLSLKQAKRCEDLVCITVDPTDDPDEVADIYARLRPICGPRLELRMIEDLLDRDDLPSVDDYGLDNGVRKVSAFGWEAKSAEGTTGTASAYLGQLHYELVEFLATDEWLIVCCHRAKSSAGIDVLLEHTGPRCEELLRRGARRWTEWRLTTGYELGIVLVRELTRSYASTGDELLGWMTKWELDFYGEVTTTHKPLTDLRGLGAEFGARLNAMDRAADGERGNWFSPAAASGCPTERFSDAAHENLDDALKDVDRLNDMLRGSLELIQSRDMAKQSRDMAKQLELQQKQAEQTEQLQRKVERITSLFLVPSLVAAFFGANTALPGGNGAHAWLSFELMIALMVASAAFAWFGLGYIRRRNANAGSATAPE